MSKPALSGRVLGMKFMQKANEKKLLLEAEEKHEVHLTMQHACVLSNFLHHR